MNFQCLNDNVVNVHTSSQALPVFPPGITTLDLARQNIVELKVNSVMSLMSLKGLLLAHNDLVGLPRGFLSGLKKLEYLTLRVNRLSLLHWNMFNEKKS